LLTIDADWKVPDVDGVSLDAAFSQRGSMAGTTDNRVVVPPRTQLDLGGRYRFRAGKLRASLRLQIANVLDSRGFGVAGPGIYLPNAARSASGYLTIDL
jgi:iron complex outermembrane receptor protein